MKQILIVAATAAEIEPTLKHYQIQFNPSVILQSLQLKDIKVNILVTGVGMVNTAYALGKLSSIPFDLAINVGIAGTFNENIPLGEVVMVYKDQLAEMGAEDGDNFIQYKDLNLGGTSIFKDKYDHQFDCLNNLLKVKGITVNKVHGNEETIKKTKQEFGAEIETMEGAAFLMGAEMLAPIVIQLRGISNRIEKRDKSKWRIDIAIKNLNDTLINLIEQI